MRLALIGTGQMGQAVEALAEEQGYEVVARFDGHHRLTDAPGPAALNGADVAIDFSLPSVVLGHIDRCCRWQVPLVVGTTGWYDSIEEVRGWVAAHDAAVLYAPNFSLGIALVRQMLRGVVPLLERLPAYDAGLHEVHHIHKADSPSGTALALAGVLLDGLSRKTHLATETQHGRIDPAALQVTAARTGGVVGTHTITFDGPFDRITLTHDAKNRRGFADGALRAAFWLRSRTGLFTLDDLLHHWIEDAALAPSPVPA